MKPKYEDFIRELNALQEKYDLVVDPTPYGLSLRDRAKATESEVHGHLVRQSPTFVGAYKTDKLYKHETR